jgi:hypothetical protein
MTEFEVRVIQQLESVARAAWAIAWLLGLTAIAIGLSADRIDILGEEAEVDTHYAAR